MCPGTPRPGFGAIDAAVLHQNYSTACAGRTMYESSKMSKVGILIDRMSSGSYWISPSSCFTLAMAWVNLPGSP
jgi:hypothetical protein